jgi:hypothetical protein
MRRAGERVHAVPPESAHWTKSVELENAPFRSSVRRLQLPPEVQLGDAPASFARKPHPQFHVGSHVIQIEVLSGVLDLQPSEALDWSPAFMGRRASLAVPERRSRGQQAAGGHELTYRHANCTES